MPGTLPVAPPCHKARVPTPAAAEPHTRRAGSTVEGEGGTHATSAPAQRRRAPQRRAQAGTHGHSPRRDERQATRRGRRIRVPPRQRQQHPESAITPTQDPTLREGEWVRGGEGGDGGCPRGPGARHATARQAAALWWLQVCARATGGQRQPRQKQRGLSAQLCRMQGGGGRGAWVVRAGEGQGRGLEIWGPVPGEGEGGGASLRDARRQLLVLWWMSLSSSSSILKQCLRRSDTTPCELPRL